jgi:hypothetical protein
LIALANPFSSRTKSRHANVIWFCLIQVVIIQPVAVDDSGGRLGIVFTIPFENSGAFTCGNF